MFGRITEDDQDTVVHCQPYKFGIGSFVLKPRPGHRYRAIFRLADGTAVPSLLPSAYKEGMVMTVSAEDSGHYRINIQSISVGSPVLLVGINRASVRLTETATLQDGKSQFPRG